MRMLRSAPFLLLLTLACATDDVPTETHTREPTRDSHSLAYAPSGSKSDGTTDLRRNTQAVGAANGYRIPHSNPHALANSHIVASP